MSKQLYATAPEDRIPLSQKVAYGFGMLGNQLFPAALAIFMVVLFQDIGLAAILVGLLTFLPRLVDALTDPLMGYITDNTKSRWGRRRPYILIGAIIAGASYIAMWQVNSDNSHSYTFYYFLFFSVIFYLGLTVFATPYVAMGYEMTKDYHERTRLMAVSQWVGQWAWVIAPWFWIYIYDTQLFASPEEAVHELSIWVGVGCTAMALMPALFCKTQKVDESKLEDLSMGNLKKNLSAFFEGFILTFRCRPFLRLCIATFFVFNAFQVVAAFSYYIVVYYMYGGDQGAAGTWPTWFGSVNALCTCFLVIPIVTMLDSRFGKKNAFIISQSISILGFLGFWWAFDAENPYLMFAPLPLAAFGIGGLFTLMMSMTADTCDFDELNSGQRREGSFGAIYWWMVKFGFALAGLGTNLVFQYVGFEPGGGPKTPEALYGLRLAYTWIPIMGTVAAIVIMLGYDITEQKAHDIRVRLDKRKKEAQA